MHSNLPHNGDRIHKVRWNLSGGSIPYSIYFGVGFLMIAAANLTVYSGKAVRRFFKSILIGAES
ncbi:MAG: hypothetical protein J7J22_03790 [Candidatus Verstraetearchaeota archaeon]|nr:hypothetical protein [Candidatus Verstraetearchaeota archaeon]